MSYTTGEVWRAAGAATLGGLIIGAFSGSILTKKLSPSLTPWGDLDLTASASLGEYDALSGLTVLMEGGDFATLHHPGGFFEVPPNHILWIINEWASSTHVPGYIIPDDFPYDRAATVSSMATGEITLIEPLVDLDILGHDISWSTPHGAIASRWVPTYCEYEGTSGGRTLLVSVDNLDWPVDITTTGAALGDPLYGYPDGVVSSADINYYVNLWIAATNQ